MSQTAAAATSTEKWFGRKEELLEGLPSSTLTHYCLNIGTLNFKSTENQWQTMLLMENI